MSKSDEESFLECIGRITDPKPQEWETDKIKERQKEENPTSSNRKAPSYFITACKHPKHSCINQPALHLLPLHASETPPPMAGPQPLVQTRPQQRRFSLIHCIVITILSLIIFVGLIALIFWLAVRPAPIDYTVEDARISGFNLTGDTLNSTFNLNIRAYNRNHRLSLYYDSIYLTVWYSEQMVAFTDVTPFFQPRRNETMLEVHAVARSTPLIGSVSAKLKHDRSAGEVELEVQVRASIRFKLGIIKTKHYMLKVYCAPMVVHFSSKVQFQRTYCDVDL